MTESEHKKVTLLYMLGTFNALLFWCDSRRPDVIVPEDRRKSRLLLRIGYNLEPAVDWLVIDDIGVTAGLAFDGVPFRVFVPWAAIYLAVPEGDDRAMVWAPSVPTDVKLGGDESEPEEAPLPKRPNHLKLVP